MTIIIGDPNLADETMYCPNCGVEIEYDARDIPDYCPGCGKDIEVEIER